MKSTIVNVLLVIIIITNIMIYNPFSQTTEDFITKRTDISNYSGDEQTNIFSFEKYIQNGEDIHSIYKHPASFQENGISRSTQNFWKISEYFPNQFSQEDIIISDKIGLMYREILNFSRIEAFPIITAVENYDPSLSPELDFIQKTEILYMSFYINGSQPVKINGFWIYLRGESDGFIRFQVFSAIPGGVAATLPNTTSPLSQEIDVQIIPNILLGEERWMWLELNETLIVDPTTTYANTFYLGICRPNQDSSKINWVCCSDDAIPDNIDEGDAYSYVLDFTYLEKDFFLNCSISPILDNPYPSDINLKVNNNVVADQITPGIGIWDSGVLNPVINMTDNNISYSTNFSWSDFYQWEISYDIIWSGYLFDSFTIETELQISSEHNTSIWTSSFTVQYPDNAENKMLNISIEKDWIVSSVLRNTINHSNWTQYSLNLLIQDTNDGLWEIEFISQNRIVEVDILDEQNKTIKETYQEKEVRICCKISDTNGMEITSGQFLLFIYDPNELEIYTAQVSLIDNSSEYNAIFLYNFHSEYQIEGTYSINIIWTNGTEAGFAGTNILVKIPTPLLKRVFTYIGWISLGSLVSVTMFILTRKFFYVPRRSTKLLELKHMLIEFQDSVKLTRLLIIHKESGLCFLDPLAEDSKIDANLMAGLLHAFSSFGGNILEENSLSIDQTGETILQYMNYKDYHIVMFDGVFIRIAAIYSILPSENVINQLKEFSEIFEERFYNELANWTGEIHVFSSSEALIKEKFALTLNLPHKTKIIEADEYNLNKLEKEIYDFSLKLMESKEYFYLENLLDNYKDVKESKLLYVFEAVISLRQKGILFSFPISNKVL